MDKMISTIPGLCSCPILIVRTKANMYSMLPEFQIIHVHAEQFPDAETPFFEHEAQQAVTEAGRVSVRVCSNMDALDKGLEILLRNCQRKQIWFLEFHFHPLDDCLPPTSMS